MSKVKVVLNRTAVSEVILKGQGTQDLLKELADGIVARAGEGYEDEVKIYKNRAVANVWAETAEARRDNSDNNTLFSAIGG